MKISIEEKNRLESIYQSFLNDPKILRMKEIPMHRGSNCYEHSFKVAKKAVRYAINFPKKNLNYERVLIAAILHDYYLYDWRVEKSKRKGHGVKHQYIAAENALKDFDISPEVRDIIHSHMWPLNIKEYPKTREAKIVSLCDKAVAIRESLTCKRHKNKKRPIYLKHISTLF